MATLFDVVTSPWAIQPEKLVEIVGVYETHCRGEKIDIKAIEAQLGRPLANDPKPYQVLDGGVAVVPLVGVLAKRASMFSEISGGVSTRRVANMLAAAANDSAVRSVVLEIDSPGGQVDGVIELAQMVGEVRAAGKHVTAWISGIGASGAYWIASAADRVLIADATTIVGSIGVVASHVDVSKAQEKAGVKTTEITAGKYKRIASSYAPLTEEGRATIQAQVDEIYSVFVETVAENRGVSVEEVLNTMADGRVFIGRAAVAAGLVDGVSTYQEVLAESRSRPGDGRMSATNPTKGMNAMDREELKAKHPALYESLVKEGEAATAAAVRTATEAATVAERARITTILAASAPGQEALQAEAIKNGMEPGKYALAVLAGEKDQRDAALAAARTDANKDKVKDAPPPKDEPAKMKRADYDRKPPAERAALARAEGFELVD